MAGPEHARDHEDRHDEHHPEPRHEVQRAAQRDARAAAEEVDVVTAADHGEHAERDGDDHGAFDHDDLAASVSAYRTTASDSRFPAANRSWPSCSTGNPASWMLASRP